MEFFENAFSKAKEVFDVACKKTGEVVTVQKQKIDIATIENKRNKDYLALGKLYFDKIKDTGIDDNEVAELVSAIKEKSEQIKQINEEIKETKNMKTCPNCESFVKDEDLFCSVCGEKIEKEN